MFPSLLPWALNHIYDLYPCELLSMNISLLFFLWLFSAPPWTGFPDSFRPASSALNLWPMSLVPGAWVALCWLLLCADTVPIMVDGWDLGGGRAAFLQGYRKTGRKCFESSAGSSSAAVWSSLGNNAALNSKCCAL